MINVKYERLCWNENVPDNYASILILIQLLFWKELNTVLFEVSFAKFQTKVLKLHFETRRIGNSENHFSNRNTRHRDWKKWERERETEKKERERTRYKERENRETDKDRQSQRKTERERTRYKERERQR